MARHRILVADDEPMITKLMRLALRSQYDVDCVGDGQGVLEAILAGARYDAILLDLEMPHMGGIETHRSLCLIAPEQAERVAFVTGGPASEHDDAVPIGPQPPRLAKPFSVGELREFIAARIAATSIRPPVRRDSQPLEAAPVD